MLPVTYYVSTKVSTPKLWHRIEGYRQRAPYNISTSVQIYKSYVTGGAPYLANAGFTIPGSINELWPNMRSLLSNKLLSRFRSSVGDQSSFGATLTAEGRETATMLSGTVLRIYRAARAAKRLQFQKVAHELGIPFKQKTRVIKRAKIAKDGTLRRVRRYRTTVYVLPNGREVAKTSAGAWLYWSYGVQPLASDIYNGLDILSKDPPDRWVGVSAKSENTYKVIFNEPGYYPSIQTWDAKVRGRAQAQIRVNNSNSHLLNEMGLTNPALWVLEAIPLSFVADWFSNLSQVVSSWNDYNGLTIMNKVYSERWTHDMTWWQGGPYGFTGAKKDVWYVRTLDLPVPKLVFAYEPPNWQRGLNAISLLVSFMR